MAYKWVDLRSQDAVEQVEPTWMEVWSTGTLSIPNALHDPPALHMEDSAPCQDQGVVITVTT